MKKTKLSQDGLSFATKADVREIVQTDFKVFRAEIKAEIRNEFEKFARMVKRGFDDINERMATKEELHAVKMELKTDIARLTDYVKPKLDDHEVRIGRLERKQPA